MSVDHILLDIRNKEAYSLGKVKGSVNLPGKYLEKKLLSCLPPRESVALTLISDDKE